MVDGFEAHLSVIRHGIESSQVFGLPLNVFAAARHAHEPEWDLTLTGRFSERCVPGIGSGAHVLTQQAITGLIC